ncbi:MAG: exopolysaccharide biosynthesis protein [Armatimonadetes bacterium]|nr:exopolysaccharide biosynthesis protein [Anaerolineae bacterium]
MAVKFNDTGNRLSDTLAATAAALTSETVSVRQLMTLVGEQGLLFFCMVLIIPFLLPVSIPGVSTVFGAVIILLGIGVILNRLPWLPEALMKREMRTADLLPALERGARLFARLDAMTRARLTFLTHGPTVNRLNGLGLTLGGILLIFPFGFIPLSNTLPALAILCFAVGMLQRDGLFILLGYLMLVATIVYFAGLLLGALAAGAGIRDLLSS